MAPRERRPTAKRTEYRFVIDDKGTVLPDRDSEWVHVPWRDGWEVSVELAPIAGRLECIGIVMRSAGDTAPAKLGPTLLRALPVGSLVREAVRRRLKLGLYGPVTAPDGFTMDHPERLSARRDAAERAAQGKRKPDFDRLERVAAIYTEAAKHREPPTKAVADALQISRGAAAKAVTTAREHGLLPKTRKGRVGPVEGS